MIFKVKLLALLLFFILNFESAQAVVCSHFTSEHSKASKTSILEELGVDLSDILDTPVILGAVLGSPPNRKSFQDSNYSHFGEFAGYRPVFNKLMQEVLSEHFGDKAFGQLSFQSQQEAVHKLITVLAERPGVGTLDRPFFIHYVEPWATNFLRGKPSERHWKFIDARNRVLKDPEKLTVLFGDFFIQYFQKPSAYWDMSSQFLDEVWTNRHNLKYLGASSFQEQVSGVGSFNPVTRGSSYNLTAFLKTSAAVIFEMFVLSQRALELQKGLQEISLIENITLVHVDAHARLMNEISKLILDVEFMLLNRERLYSDLLSAFKSKAEELQPGFFVWRQSKKDKLAQSLQQLRDSQSQFFDLFLKYEAQSTAALLDDFARINTISNQITIDSVAETLDSSQHSAAILNKLHSMGLQRTIILQALERFRSNELDD